MTPSTAPYTPAMSVEQALSKLSFAVREIERLDRASVSESQLHRLRELVSKADGLCVKIEGEKKWPR